MMLEHLRWNFCKGIANLLMEFEKKISIIQLFMNNVLLCYVGRGLNPHCVPSLAENLSWCTVSMLFHPNYTSF